MSVKSVVAGVALGLASTLTVVPMAFASGPQTSSWTSAESQDLRTAIAQLKNDALTRGVTLTDLSVNKAVVAESYGLHTNRKKGPSCTVTANVTVAGTGVVVSATASTCVEAAAMIRKLIDSM